MKEVPVHISLPSVLGYERIAMECAASFAKLKGFQPDKVDDLKTAVSEACMNAIEHGNRCNAGSNVLVIMQFNEGELLLWVKDEGRGFKHKPEEPNIERKIMRLQTPRGLGIFLIKRLVDHVDFDAATDRGHAVHMRLSLPERMASNAVFK